MGQTRLRGPRKSVGPLGVPRGTGRAAHLSWLNLIERWFRELTGKRLRRRAFRSVPDLKKAIHEYLDAYNDEPKLFIWTMSFHDREDSHRSTTSS